MNPNPVLLRRGAGLRNLNCSHYDRCLQQAAEPEVSDTGTPRYWSGFSCEECEGFVFLRGDEAQRRRQEVLRFAHRKGAEGA